MLSYGRVIYIVAHLIYQIIVTIKLVRLVFLSEKLLKEVRKVKEIIIKYKNS